MLGRKNAHMMYVKTFTSSYKLKLKFVVPSLLNYLDVTF
jgi:hypothetical protein